MDYLSKGELLTNRDVNTFVHKHLREIRFFFHMDIFLEFFISGHETWDQHLLCFYIFVRYKLILYKEVFKIKDWESCSDLISLRQLWGAQTHCRLRHRACWECVLLLGRQARTHTYSEDYLCKCWCHLWKCPSSEAQSLFWAGSKQVCLSPQRVFKKNQFKYIYIFNQLS
jgi:hypothetical protein